MPTDREATLKNAEKFLRVGRLDAAIAEYARVVEAFPKDWSTANTLGDLYVRAAQSDKALVLYQRAADELLAQDLVPKAAALLKKILKIRPDDESAQIRLADIAARQGLVADAKAYLSALASRRTQRGDTRGAEEIVIRLGTLEGADLSARLQAAELLERSGDTTGAARLYRAAYEWLTDRRRSDEALAVLRSVVRCDRDRTDPALLIQLAGAELRDGRIEPARGLLVSAISSQPASKSAAATLAWSFVPANIDAAAVCVDVIVDACAAAGQFAEAARVLEEFTARGPGRIPTLLRLVEICVDGGIETTMYAAQAQLADAYLASGRPEEARIIAEDLVLRESGQPAHIERLRRALQMLNVADVERAIAEHLETHRDDGLVELSTAAVVPAAELAVPVSAPEPPPPPPAESAPAEFVEVDLTNLLGVLGDEHPGQSVQPARPLEEVFAGIRSTAALQDDGADHLDLARAYIEMGMPDEAIGSFEIVARLPQYRFEAASSLARLHRNRGEFPRAVEWYERAAETPAPNADDSCALLYELADLLETTGEGARALAVFLEVDAQAQGYRDVTARIARLSTVETGG